MYLIHGNVSFYVKGRRLIFLPAIKRRGQKKCKYVHDYKYKNNVIF